MSRVSSKKARNIMCNAWNASTSDCVAHVVRGKIVFNFGLDERIPYNYVVTDPVSLTGEKLKVKK
jgi:hypothetical protein